MTNIIATESYPGQWIAVDDDTYDGAPDAKSLSGTGKSAQEAINDLKEKMAERDEPQTKIRPWAGWQSEANDAIGDAQHAIHQQQPDIAINCLERALNILRAENSRTDREGWQAAIDKALEQ